MSLRNGSVLYLSALLVIIAFASTSIAGDTSDGIFHSTMGFLFGARAHAPGFGLLHFVAEKSVHFILFLTLAMLLSRMLPASRWRIPVILGIALIAGSLSEWLQNFFPRRDPTLRDVGIDVCGAVAGLILYYVLHRRPLNSRPRPQPADSSRVWVDRRTEDDSHIANMRK